ncbi:MAG: H+transporting two-sector ATPase subunit [Clostridia bacterium]|jgi:V/A-type H+-transporting ATPase subunit E|nr:H+transporting two-sector ATPase subunit [Clostridia bacterium]
MSVTIEDKVELFSKIIFSNIEANSSERRQALEEKYKAELAELEKEVELKKTDMMKAASAKAMRECERLQAQIKSQEQRKLVESKQKFVDQVMTMLYGYAARLAASKDYEAVLSKAIDNVSEGFKDSRLIHFYVLPNEFDIIERLLQENKRKFNPEFKYVIEAAPLNVLGGLIAKDKENLLEIDLTLKSMVEEHRATVGAVIIRKFNEVSSV